MKGNQKNTFVFLACLLLSLNLPSAAADKKTGLEIETLIEKHRPEIIKIRRYLHMNPELSNREYETAKLIGSKLVSYGLDVKTGVAKTGVVGLLQGGQPGPTVAIRADMDALPIQELADVPFKSLNPGVMHACGHDIHMAIALGTAAVLSELREKIKGNIKFIFQPAEEGAPEGEEGGASLMIREGVLENPSVGAVFGLHVWPENVGQALFSSGNIMAASARFQITVKGKGAHGAQPHEGIDAVVLASQIVTTVQSVISRTVDPSDPAVLSIGKIEGGTKANIIAEKVVLEGTVRALSERNLKRIPRIMENVVRGITHAYGGDYTFSYRQVTPPVYNHPELAKIMAPTLTRLLGEENILPLKPQMVAEDFAFFGQKIPAFFFFLGVKNPRLPTMAPLHNPHFNPDERSIPLGIKIMTHLLLDCLDQQRLLENKFP